MKAYIVKLCDEDIAKIKKCQNDDIENYLKDVIECAVSELAYGYGGTGKYDYNDVKVMSISD